MAHGLIKGALPALLLALISWGCGRVNFEKVAAVADSAADSIVSDADMVVDAMTDGMASDAQMMDAQADAMSTCSDGIRNGNELGTDCGGPCQPCATFGCGSVETIPSIECAALVAFYNTANGMDWNDSSGWLSDPDPCKWNGVGCTAGHVTSLTTQFVGVQSGTLAHELGDLPNLTRIYFRGSNLRGLIPPELGQLTQLRSLDLAKNHLSGTIPPELGQLSSLTSLALNGNELTGAVPAELGQLTALTALWLSDNMLSGSIPSSLGNLSSLRILGLFNNQLAGEIPPSLGNCREMIWFQVQDNKLSGTLPAELGQFTACTIFRLGANALSGNVPEALMSIPAADSFVLRGQNGCLTAATQAMQDWLDSKDPGWNDGCS